MEPWFQMVATIVCAVIASSGFWAYIQKRGEKKDVKTQMLIGLAHDRIVYLGMCYIERGWITQDEYENLNDYLYKPYEKWVGMVRHRKSCWKSINFPSTNRHMLKKISRRKNHDGTDYELCAAGTDRRGDCPVLLWYGSETDADN
jgi:hypothetical protein